MSPRAMDKKPVRERAVRALLRARRMLARSRRLRESALRGLVEVLVEDIQGARASAAEKELRESQETVANLLTRLARERRHQQASALSARRNLLKLRRRLSSREMKEGP